MARFNSYRHTSDRGIGMWLVMLTLVLAIGAVVAYVLIQGRLESLQQEQKDLHTQITEMDPRIEEVKESQKAAQEPVSDKGKASQKPAPDPAGAKPDDPPEGSAMMTDDDLKQVVGARDKELEELLEQYFVKSERDKVQYDVKKLLKLKKSFRASENNEKMVDKEEEYAFFLSTLTEMVVFLHKKILIAEEGLRHAKLQKQIEAQRLEGTKQREPIINALKPAEIEEYRRMIGGIDEEINKLDAYFNQTKTEIETKIDELQKQIEAEKTRHAEAKAAFQTDIDKYKAELNSERYQETIKPRQLDYVRGKILRVDVLSRTGEIDLGSLDHVVPDLRFVVGRPGPRNEFILKGEVSISRIWPKQSTVRMEKLYDPKQPIVQDDMLLNPLFSKDPARPVRVAFVSAEDTPVGPFPYDLSRIRYNFSVNEAKRKLVQMNSIVQEQVDVYTDIVIVPQFYREVKDWIKVEDVAKWEEVKILGLDNDVTLKTTAWAFPYLGMSDYGSAGR